MDDRAAFTLRLPQELLKQLNELAWRSRKNRNEFVVELVEGAIKKAGLAPKPNATLQAAMDELESGGGHRFDTVSELFDFLEAD